MFVERKDEDTTLYIVKVEIKARSASNNLIVLGYSNVYNVGAIIDYQKELEY